MITVIVDRCKDYGRPGCLETTDDAYTFRFDDIGEDPVRFCSHCGPINLEMLKALEDAFRAGGPAFAEKLSEAVTQAEEESKASKS